MARNGTRHVGRSFEVIVMMLLRVWRITRERYGAVVVRVGKPSSSSMSCNTRYRIYGSIYGDSLNWKCVALDFAIHAQPEQASSIAEAATVTVV
eukprot:1456787-Rhodomonas_salina.4